jgi:predicted site-specific integrase-resolvase
MDATWIPLREWAKLRGLNEQTVLRYITEGRVSAQKRDGRWVLHPDAVVGDASPGRGKVRANNPRL